MSFMTGTKESKERRGRAHCSTAVWRVKLSPGCGCDRLTCVPPVTLHSNPDKCSGEQDWNRGGIETEF